MLYKLLATRNAEHDQELIAKLRLLYGGGYKVNKNAKTLLVAAPNERPEFFDYRCKQASYMPYLGQLIDYLVGALFQNDLQILPAGDAENPDTPGELPDATFYPAFSADADRKKTPFARVIRDSLTEALVCQCAWVAIDMPPEVDAETLAEEEAEGGARAYCYLIPFEQVYDWAEDDDGNFTWVILGKRIQERASPTSGRDTYTDRFVVWVRDPATGAVTYEVFETPPIKVGSEPKPEDDVRSGGVKPTTFAKIPLERIELPAGLWAGNKVGPLAEEHFRRRSDLIGAMARSLVEIPTIYRGAEIGPPGGEINFTAEDPNRGADPVKRFKETGWVALDKNSRMEFVGPSGRAYEITDKSLHDLRDEIFRSVHAMALSLANTGAAVGRSGDSKAEDRSATEIILNYLGSLAREFAVKIYTTISAARGEKDVHWVAHGLDSFDLDDRTDLITEAGLIGAIDIPSKTWKTEYKTHLALSTVPGCSPDTKAQIQKEIADGVEESIAIDAATKAAVIASANQSPADDAKDPKAGKTPSGGKPAQSPPGAPAPTLGG